MEPMNQHHRPKTGEFVTVEVGWHRAPRKAMTST